MGNHVSEHVGFDSAYFKSSKKTGGKGEINTDPEDSTSQKPVVAEETPKPSAVNLFRHGSSRSTLLRVPSFGTKKKLGSGESLNCRWGFEQTDIWDLRDV
ncbi:uncharacterized protein LOC142337159 isoform X2 [Convolutriloba macropyga]|uniref:uncharacterized protein LOC142337159 isoform X2 n=1 Tax=Convolutriloba macropyga TaxID=536237 RepID=UPI003F51DC29